MNIRTTCRALILGGLVAGAATSLVQSKDKEVSASKSTTESQKSVTPSTNMNPTKHRYWRHHGGRHPHFGSRRVRTQVHTPH
jgi:hypothetical protein